MKAYCADSNILFSAVISRNERYLQIFSENKFYTPDLALLEIDKYRAVILKKTTTKKKELESFVLTLFSLLTVVPRFAIGEQIVREAEALCKEKDEKDTMYVALAIQLDIYFTTRDKPIYDHLKAKGFEKVMMWDEVFGVK